jgi:crotonobetainyl-CoA:carnitine CoA-transferase CaiB-like acyl-CoA transferase
LKKKEGIEIVKKLTNNADVIIEPFRKGIFQFLIM